MFNDEKFLRGLLLSAGGLAGVVLLGAAWAAHASLPVSLALAGGVLLGAVALAGLEVACRRVAAQGEAAAARIAALEGEVADLKAQYQEEAAESARGSAAHDAAEAGRQQLESALRDSARTAAEARTLTAETEESVQQASRGVHAMGDAIDALNQSSSQISAILETINKIAFQTNILALNAAVEATRAGEAGAGFTVVASEVRRLAQESTTAAKQTAEHVDSAVSWIMQCEMLKTEAVGALNGVSEKVKQLQSSADTLSQSLSSASTAAAQPSESQPAS